MSRLRAEQRRLFSADAQGQLPAAADAPVRALVLALHSPADWAALAPLWRGVQADCDWPEPAIAVNGSDAFELWFALADPLPRADAAQLLAQLQRRYLAPVRTDRLRPWPAAAATDAPPLCPPFAAGPERWAAFITADLPAVFGDDPALDFEPGADAQADLLARLRPVTALQLRRVQGQPPVADPAAAAATLSPVAAARPETAPEAAPGNASGSAPAPHDNPHNNPHLDPRAFLLAVMNDAAAPLALRIEAAKALLLAPATARP